MHGDSCSLLPPRRPRLTLRLLLVCSNGLRIGVLITPHNPRLIRTLSQTAMLMKISSPADVLFSALLTCPTSPTASNSSFVDWFLAENKRRLGEAHGLVRRWFEKRGVEVANTCAGHFCWVQLGRKMGWTTVEQEKKGFQALLDGGVYLGASGTPCLLFLLLRLLTTLLRPSPCSSWIGLPRIPTRLVPSDLLGRAADAAERAQSS